MPNSAANSVAPATAPSRALRWYCRMVDALWWSVLLLCLLFALAWGALHGLIVPKIGDLRPSLERNASAALGVQVTIEAITARSGGLNSTVELANVRLFDAQGRQALLLPRVKAALSPKSLFALGFDQLVIDAPVLDVRRTAQGRILVAGLDFSRPAEGGGSGAADWFFSQDEFAVLGGTVRWTDDMRQAPPLALRDLNFVSRNVGSGHDLRLDATPDEAWGERFTVIGQFRQPLFGVKAGDWRRWQGQAHANFPLVDVSGLRQHLDLGVDVSRGRGAVRAWAEVVHGNLTEVTTDLAVSRARAVLGAGLEPLDLAQIAGRLGGQQLPDGVNFFTEGLHFKTTSGLIWPGGNVSIRATGMGGYVPAAAGAAVQGEFSADKVDLASVNQIATRLPLGTATHRILAQWAPQGQIQSVRGNWRGNAQAITAYSVTGKAAGLASESDGKPGFRNLNVEFEATQAGGLAKFSMNQGMLNLPGVFEESQISVDAMSGEATWRIEHEGATGGAVHAAGIKSVSVALPKFKISNADLAAEAQLQWQTSDPAKGPSKSMFPGAIDLKGSFLRFDGQRSHRYLPLVVSKAAREYVRQSVLKGAASDFRFVVRGDLFNMPFEKPSEGEFSLIGPVKGVTFAYLPAGQTPAGSLPWPAFKDVAGILYFKGSSVGMTQTQARLEGYPGLLLNRVDAFIPSLADKITVTFNAEAKGPLAELVGLVNATPLLEMTSKSLAKAQVSGPAELRLRSVLPLFAMDKSRVAGTVTLAGNEVRLGPDSPKLVQTRGAITFSEQGFAVPQAQARTLGGDVRFDVAMRRQPSLGGGTETVVIVKGAGQASAEGLRAAPEMGFLSKIAEKATGSMDYTLGLQVRRGVVEVGLSSDLRGMGLSLPAPLSKTPEATLALKYENSLVSESLLPGKRLEDQLKLEIGSIAQVAYQRDITGDQPVVLRGSIGVGLANGETAPLPSDGVQANINFNKIDLDAWERALAGVTGREVAPSQPARTTAGSVALSYLPNVIAIRAQELASGGRTLNNVVVGGAREGLLWRANLDARELSGYVEYRQPSGQGAGRVYARLARLTIASTQARDVEELLDAQPASVPALDVVVEDFDLGGRKLGRIEVDAINRGGSLIAREGGVREWRLNKLNVITPEATFTAAGNWAAVNAQVAAPASGVRPPRPVQERRRTVMNYKLELRNAGEFLKRFGLDGVIRGGKGSMEGQVAWIGSPLALDIPTLSGQMNLNVETGQFLKADPGLAKLLGVLSLQALPRRLSLDFRDVFTEGFSFDFIRGDATIAQGIASTNNLQMKGVNAAVLMEGSADIAKETQDIAVRVIPEINAGTASLIATAINPAIGLGTFLAQLVLRRPLILATTQKFKIEGTWVDPKIVKLDAAAAPPAADPSTSPERGLPERAQPGRASGG